MPVPKVILLGCGCFNPPTNMHLRMFEIARDHLHRMGTHQVIGGLMSPVHDAYGKKELESSTHRLQMVKLALQNNDWVKLSDWEVKQETWSRTTQVLQYHQNQVNAILHASKDDYDDNDFGWIPQNLENSYRENVQIKLLCGADLLESFAKPGLWSDDDIESIVGQHGIVVITRANTNPLEFIYNSDVLTKYSSNIIIVTEWIQNEVSSTKVRRALRRSESVKYLIPDKVLDYIYKHNLYGSKNKYLNIININQNYLTPSPCDISMESPSSISKNCMIICNNTFFSHSPSSNNKLAIDNVDGVKKINKNLKHPGQAVKILTEDTVKEVRTNSLKLKNKSFDDLDIKMKSSKSTNQLKECKSCDENLIKFIFTKHGIQVISDVETIV